MMPFFHKLIFHKLNSFTVFSVTDILQCKRATSLAHSLIVLVQFLASAEIVSLGFLVIVVFNWLMVFTFLMWCAICCNVFCDIFLAGFAETRKNRQNYLCALARCSHSWGDLQTSFSVHASQWGNLLSRAYSAHPQVFRSRGKTFCMVMATEPMHKMVVLKLKSRVIQVSFHGSFQNGMCRGWSHKRDCLTAHYDFCVSAQKTEYRCCGVFFYLHDPHQSTAARERASSRMSLRKVMGGFIRMCCQKELREMEASVLSCLDNSNGSPQGSFAFTIVVNSLRLKEERHNCHTAQGNCKGFTGHLRLILSYSV